MSKLGLIIKYRTHLCTFRIVKNRIYFGQLYRLFEDIILTNIFIMVLKIQPLNLLHVHLRNFTPSGCEPIVSTRHTTHIFLISWWCLLSINTKKSFNCSLRAIHFLQWVIGRLLHIRNAEKHWPWGMLHWLHSLYRSNAHIRQGTESSTGNRLLQSIAAVGCCVSFRGCTVFLA